jgi:putative ABC transport system permease protein
MNYLLFIIKSALEDFKRNKVRTVLTSLGILIGVASVVLLLAFGLGLKKYISDQFESFGTNLIYVLPGGVFQNGSFNADSTFEPSFDEKDVRTLERLNLAQMIAPVYQKNTSVSFGAESKFVPVILGTSDVFSALNLKADEGQLWTRSDVDKKSKLAAIGPKLAEELEVGVGNKITIGDQTFKIGAILGAKGGGGFGGPSFDTYVYIPYKSAPSLNPTKKFLSIYIQAPDSASIAPLKDDIKESLLKRYDEDDFSIVESTEFLNAINSIFGVLNMILVAIAAISLIVGGIGIMNVMYVSVTERIREIGIRRALGATQKDILWQFLAEAVILSLIGGLMGLLLSFIVVLAIRQFFPAYIDGLSVAIALGVSSSIGIIFGVFPARKAAALSPIEAIRYE